MNEEINALGVNNWHFTGNTQEHAETVSHFLSMLDLSMLRLSFYVKVEQRKTWKY